MATAGACSSSASWSCSGRRASTLAAGLPGHISRSVLVERLRKLEEIGILSRGGRDAPRPRQCRLTAAGEALIPTVMSLRLWAESWIPEDPAMVERDPDIIWAWLGERIDVTRLPARQTIIEVTMRRDDQRRAWLVLERGVEPYGCLEDPLLDETRYVYVEASLPVLLSLTRGHRSWADAIADGSVQAFGDPGLIAQLPRWFKPPDDSPAVGTAPMPATKRRVGVSAGA